MINDFRLAKVLNREDVRQMCITHEYYTKGDCAAYERMFKLFERPFSHGGNISPERLMYIAEDIKVHSDTEDSEEDILLSLVNLIRCDVIWKPE